MPIPRRFDRRPPERDQTRVNERIGVPQVRLIDEDGQQVGVVERDEALQYARDRDLDLVEVAPQARPPVCRVLDYSKYKYEQEQKAKAARRHQKSITVREIKLRPKIANNDYETKKGHVERFLRHQDKVKVTIMFRGRETTHPERGERLLMQLADELSEVGTIEQRPNLDGRNMTMMLAPVRPKADAGGGEGESGRRAQNGHSNGQASPGQPGAEPVAGDAVRAADTVPVVDGELAAADAEADAPAPAVADRASVPEP
ncbi:MAG TPA: translation initiation factor IF-3 [Thermoleophilaceae bacterium]|nr:translation initiation factor IF-3 [Thermoleophilaceae bacterium]